MLNKSNTIVAIPNKVALTVDNTALGDTIVETETTLLLQDTTVSRNNAYLVVITIRCLYIFI